MIDQRHMGRVGHGSFVKPQQSPVEARNLIVKFIPPLILNHSQPWVRSLSLTQLNNHKCPFAPLPSSITESSSSLASSCPWSREGARTSNSVRDPHQDFLPRPPRQPQLLPAERGEHRRSFPAKPLADGTYGRRGHRGVPLSAVTKRSRRGSADKVPMAGWSSFFSEKRRVVIRETEGSYDLISPPSSHSNDDDVALPEPVQALRNLEELVVLPRRWHADVQHCHAASFESLAQGVGMDRLG
ncbi:hypothetical protein T439DRAFT_161585 [Meredithblackwellia eburnea MCA 4105]